MDTLTGGAPWQVTAQEAVGRTVCAALRYHAATRDANGNVCLKGKFHDILYVVAKLAYDWELQDSHTVTRLLRDLHACEDTFERLTVGAIVGTRVSGGPPRMRPCGALVARGVGVALVWPERGAVLGGPAAAAPCAGTKQYQLESSPIPGSKAKANVCSPVEEVRSGCRRRDGGLGSWSW